MTEQELLSRVCRIVPCDEARVVCLDHTQQMFLVCSWKRYSKGEWFRSQEQDIFFQADNGTNTAGAEPVNFDYLEGKCLASGNTMETLWCSIKHYRKLQRLKKIKDPVKRMLKILEIT